MPSRHSLVYSGAIVGFVALLTINSWRHQNSQPDQTPEQIGNWLPVRSVARNVDNSVAPAQFSEPDRLASLPAISIGNAALMAGAVDAPFDPSQTSISARVTYADYQLNWPLMTNGKKQDFSKLQLPIADPAKKEATIIVNSSFNGFLCAAGSDFYVGGKKTPENELKPDNIMPATAVKPAQFTIPLKDRTEVKIYAAVAKAGKIVNESEPAPADVPVQPTPTVEGSSEETPADDDADDASDADALDDAESDDAETDDAETDDAAPPAGSGDDVVTPTSDEEKSKSEDTIEKTLIYSITLIPEGDLKPPTIVAVKNNLKGDEIRFDQVKKNPVSTYGGYLYVKGQLPAKSRLDFDFFKKITDDRYEFEGKMKPQKVSRDTGNFEADLVLENDALTAGLVLPVAFDLDKRAFAFKPIPIKNERLRNETAQTVPSISTTHGTANDGVLIANSFKFKATGKVAGIFPSDSARIWVRYRDLNTGSVHEFDQEPHKGVFKFDESTREWPVAAEKPTSTLDLKKSGEYEVFAQIVQGNQLSKESAPIKFRLQGGKVAIRDKSPRSGLIGPGRIEVKLFFEKSHPLKPSIAEDEKYYQLKATDVSSNDRFPPINAKFDADENSVALTFPDVVTGNKFNVKILGDDGKFTDIYGNALDASKSDEDFERSIITTTPVVSAGVSDHTGEYVKYNEFTKPRKNPDGFNPADKVEARVVRLYYYRDAHRVAQIINRKVRSYNKKAVSIQRQIAEKARSDADDKTLQRQDTERLAVQAAEKTRRKENELAAKEQQLQSMYNELRNATTDGNEQAVGRLQQSAEYLSNRINDLRSSVEKLRDDEIKLNNQLQKLEGEEQLARKEQFRREVAAANEDPDTYAEGVPDSDDPVEQVSVSVIGEGLIHLRGPMKGINTIRLMINEIDSPVGQVRIGIHTVQINGEDGEKMEVVADRIQKHIDHSRFMTIQTSEMLRKAIVQVASRVAHQTAMQYPGVSQADRDLRYLYCFFGRDFVNVLRSMDSELLKTGNKLLSLHSMDSTSLASALTVMSLAKNDIRREILSCFEEMLLTKLPQAEQYFFEQSLATCRDKHHRHCDCPEFPLLSQNAKFESIKGFFNAEVMGSDTISPLQREVIKLAQIFKARLITEMQYNQRVRERAVIEDRLQDSEEQAKQQKAREKTARENFDTVTRAVEPLIQDVLTAIIQLSVEINDAVEARIGDGGNETKLEAISGPVVTSAQDSTINFLAKDYRAMKRDGQLEEAAGDVWRLYDIKEAGKTDWFYFELLKGEEWCINTGKVDKENVQKKFKHETKQQNDPEQEVLLSQLLVSDFDRQKRRFERLRSDFVFWDAIKIHLNNQVQLIRCVEFELKEYRKKRKTLIPYSLILKVDEIDQGNRMLASRVKEAAAEYREEVDRIIMKIGSTEDGINEAYKSWIKLRGRVRHDLKSEDLTMQWDKAVDRVDERFRQLLLLGIKQNFAKVNLEKAQRPLDHKKFLDMLIDDLEEKHIEQLNGTRAQIANIDNYIKRVATALEDDFNNQFYLPAFRCVRQASRYRDVSLGQSETTTILANNRAFAKVSPQATMEFDLPARDILITEAMDGAKAMIDEYGALVTDGSFLAMSKLGAGQSPMTAAAGTTGGFSTERSALYGLPGSTQENILNQNGPGRSQFGSAFENLIPDPAIYKFETGTGYEIRPVVQPDGQAVVFDFNYMYTTNVREPVRADEKHLGRVKQHFIRTDVQLSNYELRRVSKYMVALKASRTARGVPLLEDIPGVGALFRPLPQQESSLQQNVILAQATIFPTLFDLMGLRWAPAIADVDPLRLSNDEFLVRGRHRALENRVYDFSSSKVDEYLRIPEANRRADLYRTQETIPDTHPNGYHGSGLDYEEGNMRDRGARFEPAVPQFIPHQNPDGAIRKPQYYQNPGLIDSNLENHEFYDYQSPTPQRSTTNAQNSLGIQPPQQTTSRSVRRARPAPQPSQRVSSRKPTKRLRSYRGTISR